MNINIAEISKNKILHKLIVLTGIGLLCLYILEIHPSKYIFIVGKKIDKELFVSLSIYSIIFGIFSIIVKFMVECLKQLNFFEHFFEDLYENLKKRLFPKSINEAINTKDVSKIIEKEKIIVFCENQNAGIFNQFGFKYLHFYPEKNSASVFIKVTAYPNYFGIRDRDFLSDIEIQKIKSKYPNYIILTYYCYENYLYHPNNIAELNLEGFNKDEYKKEVIRQKNDKKDLILTRIKGSRSSYQEFKIQADKFQDNNESLIISYLQSDNIEIFLKSFSLKDELNKETLKNYHLSEKKLSSTMWFKNKFEELISEKIGDLSNVVETIKK